MGAHTDQPLAVEGVAQLALKEDTLCLVPGGIGVGQILGCHLVAEQGSAHAALK